MSYVALHFVKINGRMYTAGEVINEMIDETKVQRLISHGAIEEVAPCGQPQVEEIVLTEKPVQQPDNEVEETHAVAEEDAEPIEIDIMDGIVGAKKTRRRKASK